MSENGQQPPDDSVSFKLTPEAASELDAIVRDTKLKDRRDVLRKAFSILRIHIQAHREGKKIIIMKPDSKEPSQIITIDHLM